jgi:hypothetical protein
MCGWVARHGSAFRILRDHYGRWYRLHDRLQLLGSRSGVCLAPAQRPICLAQAKEGPHRRHQYCRIYRVGQISVGASLQTVRDIIRVRVRCGNVQDGYGLKSRIGLDPPTYLIAVHFRHSNVEDDEVQLVGHESQSRGAIGRFPNFETFLPQYSCDGVPIGLGIVHHQNGA